MGEVECSDGRICPATEAGIKQETIISVDGKRLIQIMIYRRLFQNLVEVQLMCR